MKKHIVFLLFISVPTKSIAPNNAPHKIVLPTSIVLAISSCAATIYYHKKERILDDEKEAQWAGEKKWICAGIMLASIIATIISCTQLYRHSPLPEEIPHDNTLRKEELKQEIERNIESLKSMVLSTKTFETRLQESKTRLFDAKRKFDANTKGARGRKTKKIIENCNQRLQLELERITIGERHANLCKEALKKKLPQIQQALETTSKNIIEYQTLAGESQNEIIQEYLKTYEQEIREYVVGI